MCQEGIVRGNLNYLLECTAEWGDIEEVIALIEKYINIEKPAPAENAVVGKRVTKKQKKNEEASVKPELIFRRATVAIAILDAILVSMNKIDKTPNFSSQQNQKTRKKILYKNRFAAISAMLNKFANERIKECLEEKKIDRM